MSIEVAYKLFLTEYPDILEVPHLCEILGGLNKKTVYELIKSEQIKSKKVGKKYLVTKFDLLNFLEVIN